MPSKIEWTDEVLEVSGGCTKCSPGCTNCWAIREVWRMAHNPLLGDKWQGLVEKKDGVLNWTGKIKCFDDALDKLRKKPTTYFINSKADLFHKDVPFEFIDKVVAVIALCPQHTFQVLTKRPDKMLEYFTEERMINWKDGTSNIINEGILPLNNLRLGVSICNQKELDEKMPIALQIAGLDWISFEPLLGDIKMPLPCKKSVFWTGLKWVVVGGESGPGARPMHPDWPRNIRDQCVASGVPFFMKQWGEWIDHSLTDIRPTKKNARIVFLDGSTQPWSILYDGREYDATVRRGGRTVIRVGKKKAGRMLDGKYWEQLPERK